MYVFIYLFIYSFIYSYQNSLAVNIIVWFETKSNQKKKKGFFYVLSVTCVEPMCMGHGTLPINQLVN